MKPVGLTDKVFTPASTPTKYGGADERRWRDHDDGKHPLPYALCVQHGPCSQVEIPIP